MRLMWKNTFKIPRKEGEREKGEGVLHIRGGERKAMLSTKTSNCVNCVKALIIINSFIFNYFKEMIKHRTYLHYLIMQVLYF